jgi:hypothetical protein
LSRLSPKVPYHNRRARMPDRMPTTTTIIVVMPPHRRPKQRDIDTLAARISHTAIGKSGFAWNRT